MFDLLQAIIIRDAAQALLTVEQAETQMYIQLNNLYLSVERGEVALNIHTANILRTLVWDLYNDCDRLLDWWSRELMDLPNWINC